EFYKTIKAATTTDVVGRLLMTGVMPIHLNDITSGFDILTYISSDLDFHDLCGLSAAEVGGLLDQVFAEGSFTLSREAVMEDLRRYYNGYLFHDEAEERVYNPDMVLYFLQGLRPPAEYPVELLDPNARTEYWRLDSLLLTSDQKPRQYPIK